MDSVEMLSLKRSYYVCWLCTEAAVLVKTIADRLAGHQ